MDNDGKLQMQIVYAVQVRENHERITKEVRKIQCMASGRKTSIIHWKRSEWRDQVTGRARGHILDQTTGM